MEERDIRITVDYYYEWDDTELVNGTDDGWVVNWDTEEAYADATGADSDISIVENEIGGMGMEVEDDNKRGNAWVILTARRWLNVCSGRFSIQPR
ncbi:hypothetical protein EDM54_24110 [Brevibacillus borstelensis]|uniref:Uncharacterized protein n=1 Tax=Brevibacillus thermoruber TaxID=33942 RepID=A0A9X3TNQ3_9BACL|nr:MULTISPECIES: hypothetical protein [Brevibacillus]MDA5107876.1 hypothetical protein [Brevibacillus thermoruber]MED1747056.1 hypothetical protein [Brevibacillus borstelensis]MED1876679.1 hypothetical protein [Brevibacillus borstelensis]MED1885750.1 hypothetical protein [Brevibacillus borstelensis]RNB56369.1 hypothetical protein EDM54_24110 [Brevibacillus borstelensis]